MSSMMRLLKDIYPLRLAPVSEDADRAVRLLCAELPFKVHQYKSGLQHNGWIVPKKWKPLKAQILKDKKIIYDGMDHPLGVAGYSTSFKGKISLDELKRHLFFHPQIPTALVYHCDYYYKQWNRDWGFSLPNNLFKKLKKGTYDVVLETIFEDGTMKSLDYLLSGESEETVILNAHNCHAGQANDDIAGVVVAIEVIKRLRQRKKRKYSYRLIIAPEHLGTVFYLANMPKKTIKTFKYGIFIEMPGNNNRLALQESFWGDSLLDRAAHHYLEFHFPDYLGDKFRKIVGNDETVWESPGYEIPCISLSRYPYIEYHSNFDDAKIISEKKLSECVDAVLGITDILETNVCMKRKFDGLVALSNPKYDLYMPQFDPSKRFVPSPEQRKWNYLMDCLIRYFDGKTSVLDIAVKHQIDYFKLLDYLKKFEEKGLIYFIDSCGEK